MWKKTKETKQPTFSSLKKGHQQLSVLNRVAQVENIGLQYLFSKDWSKGEANQRDKAADIFNFEKWAPAALRSE
ncbi:unnamed protein product [Caenorhabditis nigoni]